MFTPLVSEVMKESAVLTGGSTAKVGGCGDSTHENMMARVVCSVTAVTEGSLLALMLVVILLLAVALLLNNLACYSLCLLYGFSGLALFVSLIATLATGYKAAKGYSLMNGFFCFIFLLLTGLILLYFLDVTDIINLE